MVNNFKIDTLKPEEIDLTFGFERALMLMREGKKVQQVGHPEAAYYIEDDKLWQEGPVLAGSLTILNASEIITSRWVQV